jgi:hypothetical protein
VRLETARIETMDPHDPINPIPFRVDHPILEPNQLVFPLVFVRGVYPWHKPNLGTHRVEGIHQILERPEWWVRALRRNATWSGLRRRRKPLGRSGVRSTSQSRKPDFLRPFVISFTRIKRVGR